MQITFKGVDSWSRPVFQGENGRFYKSVALFNEDKAALPGIIAEMHTVSGGFEGEPEGPSSKTFELVGDHPWKEA